MTTPSILRVRVPGSTSNLGPGFDLLGLALDVQAEVRCLGPSSSEQHELVARRGTASEWPGTPDDILFRAIERVARELRVARKPQRFEVDSAIPVARGLGSSGAACAAGLLLGNEIYGEADQRLSSDALIRLGIELEGHPENSTASLLGGAVLCVPEKDGSAHVVRQTVDSSLKFVVAWPSTRVATNEARGVLPTQIAFADAVENPRRLALLLEGLREGSSTLLRAGVQDRLHAAYRLQLVAGGQEALDAAHAAGAHCATISGSGSTLIAICSSANAAQVCDAFERALEPHHDEVTAREVSPVLEAPRVTRES